MKKGDVYEGIVEKIEFPNRGIMRIEGEKLVVKNALPGQKLKVTVVKKRKGRCEARVEEVLENSPLETEENPCPHFGSCGGCLYQTLSYEEQLKIKETQVKELLDSVCDSYEFEGIQASPRSRGYRNKMEFSFGDEYKDGPLALGLHRRGSFYDVVNTVDCRIADRDFGKILEASREYFASRGVEFYKKMRRSGYLRHLLVRKAARTGEILVDLVTTTQRQEDLSPFADCLKELELEGTIVGILHTENDSLADAVHNDFTEILYGRDYFYEELLGLTFKISPFSFFQTNSLGAEVLYEKAREYVGETKDKTVFDLYSGTGTIAQMIAPVAKKVVGVEIVEEAVEAAIDNARQNGLSNCEFIAGDVLQVLREIEEKPDFIVLDPPRDGIHPKALNSIIGFGVDRLVYISCKPTSLVRDLAVFREAGYCVERACAVDMFPGSANCEVCVELRRKNDEMFK